MISRETIDEVLLRNDIESLIGSYVSLKRAGSNLKGLCPFHNEKTPSFVVYPSENSFYCFGCGIGGNAITFIRQMEHLDYPDAISFLAKRAGITVIDNDEQKYKSKQGIKKDRLLKMNVDAAKFFNRMLFAEDSKSRAALSYFVEERRLSPSTIKHFGLGYAPDSYDTLIRFMTAKGYSRDELVEGFFAVKNASGKYFDNFRNRVMFPIIDVSGNVIAFGGRVMDDSKPKYRNTMDTVAFKKSRNLFALNFAKQTGTESLILCEGYMDVIALHAAGFTNAVATLGTAITGEQARLLSRYTKKVNICYDADEAGQKAAQRAIAMLGEVGLDVGVIRIPEAKDPDEYIKKFGKEKFASIISNSKSKFEYNMESILSRFDISLPQDKINALSELEKLISRVYSKAEQDIYIQNVAERLSVDKNSLRADVERLTQKNINSIRKSENEKLKQSASGYGDKVNQDFSKAPAIAGNEENVLGLLLLYPDHQKRALEGKMLSADDFFTEFNRRVFEYIADNYGLDPSEQADINSVFSPEEVGRITKMKVTRMNLTDNGTDVFDESVSMLKTAIQSKNASSTTTIDALEQLLQNIRNKN